MSLLNWVPVGQTLASNIILSIENVSTTPFTLGVDNSVVFVDSESNDIVVNLPYASGAINYCFFVKKVDMSENKIQITPQSTDFIDGLTLAQSYDINIPNQCIQLLSDGVNSWRIL